MAAKNITIRFRDFELERIDELAEEMGYETRADVVRAALDLLRAQQSIGYRKARRAERECEWWIEELVARYGKDAVIRFEPDDDGGVNVTIDGQSPKGVRALLENMSGYAVVNLEHEASGTGLRNAPGWAAPLEDFEGFEMSLRGLGPRGGPDGMPKPLRDPPYDSAGSYHAAA